MRKPRKSKVLCNGKRVRWTPDLHDYSQKDEDGWIEDIRDLREPAFHAYKDDPSDPLWYMICERCQNRTWTPGGHLKKIYAKNVLEPMVNERTTFMSLLR